MNRSIPTISASALLSSAGLLQRVRMMLCLAWTRPLPVSALRGFDLLTAFPDMNNNYHRFYVDPFEPNRVWFQTRCFATHTGDLLGKPPTGKKLELPPQSFSMVFNEQGQVKVFNVGYVVDRTVGNTGGLGGAFGFFWATGNALPFPECEPFKGSWQLRGLGLLQKLQKLLPAKE